MNQNIGIMKFRILILAVVIVTANFYYGFSGETVINVSDKEEFKIIENDYSKLKLNIKVSTLRFSDIILNERHFTNISIDDYGHSVDHGNPSLPVRKELIEIPNGAELEINIIYSHFKEYNLADYGIINQLIPVQPSLSKEDQLASATPFEYDELIYNFDFFLESEIVSVNRLGTMRGVDLARLEIAPVNYNPVQNTIRVYDEIEMEIIFNNGNTLFTKINKREKSSPFFKQVYSGLMNYQALDSDELITNVPVTYIVVSDPMFETTLQSFVEWKTQKGFRVIEAYTDDPLVGNTSETIKSYLENFYNNPPEGVHPQSFVLLVGDIEYIPSFQGIAGNHVTDLHYSEYTGDVFPESFAGRISVNNTSELEAYLLKLKEYEKYQLNEVNFLDTTLLVHTVGGYGNDQTFYAYNNYLNEDNGIFTYMYNQGGAYWSLEESINNGMSFMHYCGNCGTYGLSGSSFNITDIPSLTNEGMYPVIIASCGPSADFSSDCFGEQIVKAANKGALSYIGTTNSTYYDEDFWWAAGYKENGISEYDPGLLGLYDRWFHTHDEDIDEWYVTLGQFCVSGNLAVSQSASSLESYYWETYTLLGDPSMMIYLPQPAQQNVSFESSLPIGSEYFYVNSEPFSYIGLSANGILYGAGIADENGEAAVVILQALNDIDSLDIVITGQSLIPYFGSVEITDPVGMSGSFKSNNEIKAYPNPNKGEFVICFNLTEKSEYQLSIFNTLGEEVVQIQSSGLQTPGNCTIKIEEKLEPGIYLCKLKTNSETAVSRIVVSK